MTPLKDRSTSRPMVASAALVALLTLAGCGASAPAATQDSDTTTQTDAPAQPTNETSAPAGDGGNGSATGDFCLNTVEEVATAFEVEGVETTSSEVPGMGGSCLYTTADGDLFFGIGVISSGHGEASFASTAEAAAAGGEGIERLDGIGDEAFYVPVMLGEIEGFGILFKQGDTVVNIGPTSFDLLGGDLARLRAATEELARMAAGR